ncbi:MAG: DEAD/DEAH box helicase, partial [Bifidobacteriaceae bacterium]|nr:DEAD/DEAH box helicase [Bifidobacteriaceae bacterium]
MNRLVAALGEDEERARCVTHVAVTAATAGRHAPWPAWLPEWLTSGYGSLGVAQPWAHQVRFMERARDSHAVIATSTGSGKSLALWAPVLSALDEPYELGRIDQVRARPAAIYLAPTKALAADQFTALRALFTAADVEGIEVGVCDGDTPTEARRWLRSNVDVLLTNPDYLHFALLPGHTGWAGLLRGLRYVLIDELHAYRGVMGAHVAWVIRRLRRLARHYGADPIFLAASATVSEPAETLARLIGEAPEAVTAVAEDTSARGDQTFVMWRPAPFDADEADTLVTTGKGGASGKGRRGIGGPRRSAAAETARLLAALTDVGARSVAFVRSRFAAETVAESARAVVGEPLAARIATYRGGYLAEERRGLEDRLRDGSLLGVVATSALELGIDVSGLDAVLIAGWPGTRVALKQRAGRAGRAGADGLAVWVAGTDPLDSYLVEHPDSVLGPPLEACVFDPSNVYVSAPHLAAATAELPLHVDELAALDAGAAAVLDSLAATGAVRRRGDRWFWLARERATDLTDLRGSGGGQIQVVEQATGQVLGTVDSARAPATVHPGAVYLHQGS